MMGALIVACNGLHAGVAVDNKDKEERKMNTEEFEVAELAQHKERNGAPAQCIMNGKALQPIEYKVIVRPDLIEETDEVIKSAKASGIAILDSATEKEKNQQITGTLIAVGGKAFEEFGNPMPKVGDKVYFAKYAGLVIKSDDGTEHRLMNDKDITGVLV